jgi:hypothetical protein
VGEAVPPSASEGLCVLLAPTVREGLPLGEALRAGEAEALALPVPPAPPPAAVAEGHAVPLPLELTALTLGVRGALIEAQPLALAKLLELPLGGGVRVAPPGSEGEGLLDIGPLRVATMVGLPLTECATVGEGEKDGCGEGEGENDALSDGRALPLYDPVPLARAVAETRSGDPVCAIEGELHTLPLSPPLREGELLAEPLSLRRATVGEGDTEPEPVCARLGEGEPLMLALPLALALAEGEALSKALDHEDALPPGLREAEALREEEPEPLPQALALRETVGEREEDPHALALRVRVGEREELPHALELRVMTGVGDAEEERLPLPLFEELPQALRLPVCVPEPLALVDELRHGVGLPEALAKELALREMVTDGDAKAETLKRERMGEAVRLAEVQEVPVRDPLPEALSDELPESERLMLAVGLPVRLPEGHSLTLCVALPHCEPEAVWLEERRAEPLLLTVTDDEEEGAREGVCAPLGLPLSEALRDTDAHAL